MQLFESLKVLAETIENQVTYLTEIGTFPSTDELALQFADTYQVFKGKLDEKDHNIPLNEQLLKNLDAINALFDSMSDKTNNRFWDISSLDTPEWTKVRELARETIPLLSAE